MKFTKTLAILGLFAAAFSTPAFAQISWSNQSPAGISDDIWSVAYANNTFAAVTTGGKLLTSGDGLTWSTQDIDPGVWLVSIAYGDGKWVTVGAAGTILVSPDLKTWVNAKSATTNKLNGVLYNGLVWLAVGDSATIVSSPDALTWTVQAVPSAITGFLHGITLVPDYSLPATGGTVPVTAFLVSGALAGNGTGTVDSGVLLLGDSNGMNFAQDLTSFTTTNGPTGPTIVGNLEAVLSNPGATTVAVGWEGTILYDDTAASYGFDETASLTKRVWYNPSVNPPDVVYRGLAFGGGYYVAAGEQGTILSSTDGITWTQRFSGDSPSTLSTATLLGAAYSSTLQRFVIVGTGGTILVSNSQPTVFGNVSTRGYVSPTETFIGGFVIQGSAPRTVLIRGDGPVLSTFSVPSPLADPVVTVYNSAGAVVATNTGWGTNTNPTSLSTAALEVGAFALPSASADSALLLTLAPGAYTVEITSAKGNSGIALFEAYTD